MTDAHIRLELTPKDLDLIFIALQQAPMPVGFVVVKELLDKINDQGQPQLAKLATVSDVESKEPSDDAA